MSTLQPDNAPEGTSTIDSDIPSIFSDFDLYLFGQGKHYRIYEKMGAHPRTVNGVAGGEFSRWGAPAPGGAGGGGFYLWGERAHTKQRPLKQLGGGGGVVS